MEDNNKIKCSFKKHEQIEAVIYCQECNIYMCNKCKNHHSELFDFHHLHNIDKNINEIFTGFCKEKHHNKELSYFCKNHNTLCCAVCLCKIEDSGNGLHKSCDVCLLKEIKDEKRNKLIENKKYLEQLNINIEKSINELNSFLDIMNKNKEKIIINIQEIFTKIRNEINKREDELILEIENICQKINLDENLMKLAEKLPKKIKSNIVKASTLEKEWEKNTLCSTLNECINIENNIKEINTLTEKIKDFNENGNIQMKFNIKDNEIKNILDKIKSFGTISDNLLYKFKFKEGLNYTISNNGLIATKTSGGDLWNCTVIGDKEIPKNKISKWKIKINNFKIKNNSWNILIGVGPKNVNNEDNFYNSCLSFICGNSQISNKSGGSTKYNNHSGKLKEGDIIEVIVDRLNGDLSFSINNINYGLTNIKIPEYEELYPIVLINDEKQIVELIQ